MAVPGFVAQRPSGAVQRSGVKDKQQPTADIAIGGFVDMLQLPSSKSGMKR